MMSRLNRTLAVTPLLLALIAPAIAQQPATEKTAPATANLIAAEPLFVAHVDGPDKLRATFLATNLGKMFASDEFKGLLEPVFKMLEQMKEEASGEVPIDLDELEKAVKNYGGRLTVAMHVVDEIDFGSSEPPLGFTVVLSPDGRTDLKGLVEKCSKMAEEEGGEELFDVEVEGKTFRCVNDTGSYEEGEWAAAIPFMHAGHAVLCISSNLKASLKMVLNPDQKPRFEADARLKSGSLAAMINVAKVMWMIEEGLKGRYGDDYADSEAKVLMDLLGFRSLDAISMAYRARGPYVATDTVLRFNAGARGVLAAVFPKSRDVNPFLASLPRTTSLAQSLHLDIGTLYTSVKKIWRAMEETDAFVPMSWDEIESAFEDEFGFRLKEDFLDHMGAYGILAQQVSEDEDEELDVFDDPDGTCLAFQVKNPDAFGKRIDTILRTQGQHTGRKEEDYKGQKVYRLNLFGMTELHYAVADRLFLLGFGNKGDTVLRAVLDADKDARDGKEPAPLSSGLKARLRTTQPGYQELGWVNVSANLKAVARLEEQLGGFMIDIPDELGALLKLVDKVRPLLKTYNANEQLSLMRTEGNTIIYRTVW